MFQNPAKDTGALCLSTDQLVEQIGVLADRGLAGRDMSFLNSAKDLSTRIDQRFLSGTQLAVFHYHLSNVWGNTEQLQRSSGMEAAEWEQEGIEKQLIHNRLSVAALEQAGNHTPVSTVCTITTNLANVLFQVGRFVEALETWDSVLCRDPNFGMALANKGLAMLHYAHLLPDKDHAFLYLVEARKNLQKALKTNLPAHARRLFQEHLHTLKQALPRHVNRKYLNPMDTNGQPEGTHSALKQWKLKNRLFLNPLNDLGCFVESADDRIFEFPFLRSPSLQSLSQALYQSLTREFVFSVELYFESLLKNSGTSKDGNESAASINLEKIKLSFRVAFSLLDKIAFFLKRYYGFSIPDKRVGFRTIWYRFGKKYEGLHPSFRESRNRPLQGLFWLSKDLYDSRADFQNGLESDARGLHSIRNRLEHNYLMLENDISFSDNPSVPVMSESDFARRGLRMLKLIRSALNYLALAIYQEENPNG